MERADTLQIQHRKHTLRLLLARRYAVLWPLANHRRSTPGLRSACAHDKDDVRASLHLFCSLSLDRLDPPYNFCYKIKSVQS